MSLLTNVNFSDIITFTRASSATYFDSSGVMQTASTDVARLNYDPATLLPLGLLVEPAATNLVVRSREFDAVSWGKTDTTITADAANGVGGTATMDLFTEGSAGTAILFQGSRTIVANSTNTFAIDLKRGNTDWVRLRLYSATSELRGWFNLATGAVGSTTNTVSATGATVSITNLGNGIYRCALTGAVNNSDTTVNLSVNSSSADASSSRVSGATYYADRAQLETGSVATSFIETTSATVTRAADVAVMTGTNFSDWFNPAEGTFVVDYDGGTQTMVLNVSDGDASDQIQILGGSSGVSLAVVSASSTTATAGTRSASGKVAVAYAVDNYAACNNGGTVGTDSSGALPIGLNQMRLGATFGGATVLNGHIRSLTYYPTRLPNATLQSLTT